MELLEDGDLGKIYSLVLLRPVGGKNQPIFKGVTPNLVLLSVVGRKAILQNSRSLHSKFARVSRTINSNLLPLRGWFCSGLQNKTPLQSDKKQSSI